MATEMTYPFPDPPGPGQAIEVAEGVLWLRLPLPMALDHVNIFALDDGDGWTLVDSGIDCKRSRAEWQQLLDGPLAGRPVRRVLLTHYHPDHVGLAGWFQAHHGAELVTTRTAWLYARMLQLDEQDRPVPETVRFWREAGMEAGLVEKRLKERPFNFADMVAPMPLGFTRIAEGSVVTAGGRRWDVRIGNGHAAEHATFWSRDDNLVIGGDQLLASISPNIGVHPTEPLANPLAEWLEACERLGRHATPDQLVLPGHKLPFTGLPLRLRQMIDNHLSALDRLHKGLDSPRKAAGCFEFLFRREISEGVYGLALAETVAHLNYLLAEGRVTRQMTETGAWAWQAVG
ncbi:MAG: MBL fold metallo-hydrolase [Qingshengfaniella sp.]